MAHAQIKELAVQDRCCPVLLRHALHSAGTLPRGALSLHLVDLGAWAPREASFKSVKGFARVEEAIGSAKVAGPMSSGLQRAVLGQRSLVPAPFLSSVHVALNP